MTGHTRRWIDVPLPVPEPPHGIVVAVIDSGVTFPHPHLRQILPGVSLLDGDPSDTVDRVGHGTAVAAAIQQWAPWVQLLPVRVMDATRATSARRLADGIVSAVERGAQLINVSMGTLNPVHAPLFAEAVEAAVAHGAVVVAAAGRAEAEPPHWLPGSMQNVVGVLPADACPRGAVAVSGSLVLSSPLPRPIPGVPDERNLSGVSFAVANVTGLIARLLTADASLRTSQAILDRLSSS